MVCSSVIFIPGIMIYEFIKAWKVTSNPLYQVKLLFFSLMIVNCCSLKVTEPMPHYLRMLAYAREPDVEWGPAKNENRYGRYQPKIDKSISVYQSDINDDNSNLAVDSENIFRVRL